MFGRSQGNQHPFFTANQRLVSNSGLCFVPETACCSLNLEYAMSGYKITCFLDMALNYILPVKSWRLKPKLYWQGFSLFWLIPLQRWLPTVFHPPCAQTDRKQIWAAWCPCQGFCHSVGWCSLPRALCIWEGVPKDLQLLGSLQNTGLICVVSWQHMEALALLWHG